MTSKKWQLPNPSVFTPFFRRFTDERALDVAETQKLYDAVTSRHRASVWAEQRVVGRLVVAAVKDLQVELPEALLNQTCQLCQSLFELENAIFSSPPVGFEIGKLSLKESVDLRRFLRAQEHFLDHDDKAIDKLIWQMQGIVEGIVSTLPLLDEASPFTVPMVNLLPEPSNIIASIVGSVSGDATLDLGLFSEVSTTVENNIYRAYGIDPKSPSKKPMKKISEMQWGPQEATDNILKHTPFHDFLMTPVPLKFDHQTRFSHIHVVGGSGAGKTQLLQNLILHDLQSDDPPSLIVVDSQGDLINKLSRLEIFHLVHGELAGKLTIISPRDIKYPPAINIFDIHNERLNSYSPAMREQVVAGVIQTFDYLFAGLLGADLTAKQSVFFRFVARLMLALPETMGRNATILDMMNLMDDPAPYRDAIKSLPQIQRNFFERDFNATGFRQTKEQIRYRLQAILENPTLERLFTSETTKIDLFSEMNKGGIILIDTAKDFLKGSSAHFGRIFISLVLQAAMERASIPEKKRKPAFLIVDEAADYFDENIDDLLTQVRKYSVGCLFAHQFMDQCSSSLRASLAANTSTKLCAALSVGDARMMAAELRTTPERILSQKKLHFACFIRNVTPEAVSIPVEVGKLESEPKLSRAAFDDLMQANHRKVSAVFDRKATFDDMSTGKTSKASSADNTQQSKTANSARQPSPQKATEEQGKATNPRRNSTTKPQDDSDEPSPDW